MNKKFNNIIKNITVHELIAYCKLTLRLSDIGDPDVDYIDNFITDVINAVCDGEVGLQDKVPPLMWFAAPPRVADQMSKELAVLIEGRKQEQAQYPESVSDPVLGEDDEDAEDDDYEDADEDNDEDNCGLAKRISLTKPVTIEKIALALGKSSKDVLSAVVDRVPEWLNSSPVSTAIAQDICDEFNVRLTVR